jgi:hypothetical protein
MSVVRIFNSIVRLIQRLRTFVGEVLLSTTFPTKSMALE